MFHHVYVVSDFSVVSRLQTVSSEGWAPLHLAWCCLVVLCLWFFGFVFLVLFSKVAEKLYSSSLWGVGR